MTVAAKPKWEFLFRIHGGHKFYAHRDGHRFGIADGSGNEPDATDDGPLYLDFHRPLTVYLSSYSGGALVHIPLYKSDSNTGYWTSTPVSFLREVSSRWPQWRINMHPKVIDMVESMKIVGLI